MRLNQFDYFRAIAIIMIVAGHVCMSDMLPNHTLSEQMIVSIMTGGTALFVFISGFFFHHVFYKKFKYKAFMVKKIKNVFIPYAVITTVFFLTYVILQRAAGVSLQSAAASQTVDSGWLQVLSQYLTTLTYGQISGPYWYIPFIMIMFALSPLFLLYIQQNANTRFAINLVSIVFSMLIFRAGDNTLILHNTLYFLPMYLLGINYSIHKHVVDNVIAGRTTPLFGIVALLAFYQVNFLGVVGHFLKMDFFTYQGLDTSIIQKIFLCLLCLSFFQKFEDKEIPLLKLIASASFAIFFIHPFVIRILEKLNLTDALNPSLPYLMMFLLLLLLIAGSSLGIALLVKAVLKSNSKYLTGW